eukprot:g21494.t1
MVGWAGISSEVQRRGVARVVDLVDFWDRRGSSAVSSDMVGAGAVVTFLCCSAVSGPALAMTGVCISRENSSKVGSRGVTHGACAG